MGFFVSLLATGNYLVFGEGVWFLLRAVYSRRLLVFLVVHYEIAARHPLLVLCVQAHSVLLRATGCCAQLLRGVLIEMGARKRDEIRDTAQTTPPP